MQLKATFDEENNCWRLNGVKRFITNGDSDIHLVLARSEEGTTDGRGLSMFIYDKRDGGVDVRRIENKMGIHGLRPANLFKTPNANSAGTSAGPIKYVMSLRTAPAWASAPKVSASPEGLYGSPGLCEGPQAVRQGHHRHAPGVRHARHHQGQIDAGRSLLYQTSRYVDIYKALESIAMTRPLTPEERKEAKQYSRLADAFTPLSKGMNSEYANQNTYDCIQVHGGSGFMMEYACQRLYRDARITSIYEGTTQLQVVAAIRYVTNGTYATILRELEQEPVHESVKPLMDRVVKMTDKLDAVVARPGTDGCPCGA